MDPNETYQQERIEQFIAGELSGEALAAFEAEMNGRGADWQLHSYGRTMHAFTNPQANDPGFGTVYNETADKRSWRTLMQFLDEIFT